MTATGIAAQSSSFAHLALDLAVYNGYKPLDPHKRDIRLLSITSPDLNCRLHHASLDDQPTYSALSYYWGAPGASRTILINDIELQMRKTLHQFLKALYRRRGPLTVWLDVICINQHDLAEQSAQVAMMGDIYSEATCVYAWLGKGDADTDLAIAALQQTNSGLQSSAVKRRVLAGVKQLFLREYWTRVWIVQECLMNKKLILVCGAMMIEFDDLLAAIRNLTAMPRIDSLFEDDNYNLLNNGQDDKVASARLTQIESGRRSLAVNDKQPLVAWMALFASSDCQDPRDRFYGFRALASDGDLFRVDYTSNTVDLLLQALSIHNRSHFARCARCMPID